VNGSTNYEVVRFGLQNKGSIASSRVSDAGLSAAHSVNPSWVPGYSPHSFTGGPVRWRMADSAGKRAS
jgi:hypothetical protein